MGFVEAEQGCFTNIGRDWQNFVAVPFSPDRDFTPAPVDVINLQTGHLASASTQLPQNH
ncbi:MAG TPA: hypothetical protein VJ369_10190 [Glutamicibacter sp.]|nr:hypothetical protein [Glutamicibacter sp.]HJX78641.1 hypothetical protein [Glutamicibacter sp.]